MAGSGSRKTAEDIKNIDMMTVRNKTQQEVTDVIFPNGLTVGLNDPRFNNGMRINGNMQCNGAVNATGPNASFRINGVPLPTEAVKGAPGVSVKGAPGLSVKGAPGEQGPQGDKGAPGLSVKGAPGVATKGEPGVATKGEPGLDSTIAGPKGEPGVSTKGEPGVATKGEAGRSGPGIFGSASPAVFVYDEDGLNPSPSTSSVTFNVFTGLSIFDPAIDDVFLKVTASTGMVNESTFTDAPSNTRTRTVTAPASYPGSAITVTCAASDGDQTGILETTVSIACVKNGEKGAKGSFVKGPQGDKGAPGSDGSDSTVQKTIITGYDGETGGTLSSQSDGSETVLTFQTSNAANSFFVQKDFDPSSNITLPNNSSPDIVVSNTGEYTIDVSLEVKPQGGSGFMEVQLVIMVDNGSGGASPTTLAKSSLQRIARGFTRSISAAGFFNFNSNQAKTIGLKMVTVDGNGNTLTVAPGSDSNALRMEIEKVS